MNTEMNIQHETTPGYPVGFNNLLERQRESLHLNREEAAETLGITVDRLEALETGKTVDAVASELVDIRSVYGLSGEFLLDVFEANRAVVANADTAKQAVVITLSTDGEEMKTNISFEPGIAGENSEEIGCMSEQQKTLQAYAQHILCAVIDSIKS